jgi:Bacterial Ig-like domain (group 2).
MSSTSHKVRLIGALAALAALALAVSCRGFFVKPTLSSIAVGPGSPSIQTGSINNTVQMFAVGTFNDGSTGNPPVSWSISDNTKATISANGLVTSVATGSATVTATSKANPSITGTQTVTVTVGCIQSIAISPTSASITASGSNNTFQFTATATTCNGSFPITNSATWNTSNPQVATGAGGVATGVAAGTVTISATSGGITSNINATLTVGP